MPLIKLKVLVDYLEIDMIKNIFSNWGVTILSDENIDIVNQLYKEIIYNNVLDNVIIVLDQKGMDIIEKVAKSGYLKTKENDPYLMYLDALSDYGLLFKLFEDEEIYYTIASEVYELICRNKPKIEAEFNMNQLIFKFAKAAVAYYGLLNKDEIMELYNYYHRYKSLDILPRLSYLSKLQSVFTFNGKYLYDNNVTDIEKFIKDKEHFKDLSLYKYTSEQFYVDEHFVDIDIDFDFYNEMVQYFADEIGCDYSIIVAIYYFLMYEYNIENLKDTIEKETVVDTIKLNQKFDNYVKELYQSVRCWVLKGHMVRDVNEMIERSPNFYLESDFVLLKKPEKKNKKRGLFSR